MARYLTIEDGREYLWDFDENRILLVTYGDTENIRQVEFSTDDTEGPTTWTSEVMTNPTTGNKYVQVPNEFLNGEYSRLVCYVIAEDETGQHTRTKEIFRIKKRQQPEDYEITFTDRMYIRDLKAIAERYRDQAKSYSESASASSTQAGQHNSEALASKNAAAESERNAEASMKSAQSAQHGAESARNAANTILEQVQSKGTEITNFVATSKTEIETQKNESVNAVKSVYQTDLDELKGDLDDIVEEVKPVNLFNKLDSANHKTGYFLTYDSVTGKIIEKENQYFSFARIPAKENTEYTASLVDYVVYFTGDDGITETGPSYNSSADTLRPCNFTTNPGTKYICLSWRHATVNEDNYMVVEGDALPSDYLEYFDPYLSIKNTVKIDKASIENEYTVALDGTGDFISFTGCLEALKDNTLPKVIYVKAGTYDVFEEIGGSEFCKSIASGTNWKDVSVCVPNNTRIVGIGLVILQFKPTGEAIGPIAANLISPINVMYNAEFENIYIDSQNCRYAIHSDGYNDAIGIKQVFKNVRIKHRYVNYGMVNGFGAGTRQNNTYIFENCVFDAFLPLSYHNNGGHSVDGTQIIFNNCVFKTVDKNTYPCIRLGAVNQNLTEINVRLSNCYLNSGISLINEVGSGTLPNPFNIDALNCSSFAVDVGEGVTNSYTPTVYSI